MFLSERVEQLVIYYCTRNNECNQSHHQNQVFSQIAFRIICHQLQGTHCKVVVHIITSIFVQTCCRDGFVNISETLDFSGVPLQYRLFIAHKAKKFSKKFNSKHIQKMFGQFWEQLWAVLEF